MTADRNEEARGAPLVFEAAPGRAPAGARDGADELLRLEDRFTDEERARPARRWLSQRAINRPVRIQVARQQTGVRVSSLAAESVFYATPTGMLDFSEETLAQARKAFDSVVSEARRVANTIQEAAEATPSNPLDLYTRSFEYAQQNVIAAFDLAQKLVRSRDLQEAMQHQAQFVSSQFAAIQTQAKEFGGLAQTALQQSAEKAKGTMQESAEHARKAMEEGAEVARKADSDAKQAMRNGTNS